MGSKILCKHHNETLSELDDEALRLFDCLLSFRRRERISDQTIDGKKIERWMIKFLLGFIFSGNATRAGGASTKSADVPDEWLGLLFGRDKFRERAGLIFFQAPSDEISIEPIECTPNTDVQTGSLFGVRIALCGFNFHTGIRPINWERPELCMFRPSGFSFPDLGWKIIFQWESGESKKLIIINNDPFT